MVAWWWYCLKTDNIIFLVIAVGASLDVCPNAAAVVLFCFFFFIFFLFMPLYFCCWQYCCVVVYGGGGKGIVVPGAVNILFLLYSFNPRQITKTWLFIEFSNLIGCLSGHNSFQN